MRRNSLVGYRDAYERLLMDVVRGNSTLFMRNDEVLAAWRWIDPIREGWESENIRPRPYPAGSWGPSDATALIARDGRAWQRGHSPDAEGGIAMTTLNARIGEVTDAHRQAVAGHARALSRPDP